MNVPRYASLAIVALCLSGRPAVGSQAAPQGSGDESARRQACERPSDRRRAEGVPPCPEELEAARRRWEALRPEQRAQLAERYRRFSALGESARRELRERAQNLERLELEVCRRLSPEERARLDHLEPTRRAEVMREMVRGELENQGERISSRLPQDLRERLARAGEEERLHHFQQFKIHVRERVSRNAIRSLGRELELAPEEVAALLELPGPARVEAALELGKRLGRLEVERSGLPRGLTLEGWREIEALPPEAFHEAFLRLSDGWGRPPSFDGARSSLAHELRCALRPTQAQILEHAELSREERLRAIRLEQRPRLTELVRQSGRLSAEQLAQLEALSDDDFHTRVRRIARERGPRPEGRPEARARGGWHGPRRRPAREGSTEDEHSGDRLDAPRPPADPSQNPRGGTRAPPRDPARGPAGPQR